MNLLSFVCLIPFPAIASLCTLSRLPLVLHLRLH
jgi:hypothetical protein